MIAFFTILTFPIFIEGRIITVDDDGNADYDKIQDAINASNDGDIIYVYNGIYNENIFIDKRINLTGEDKNKTIINGRNKKDCIVIDFPDVEIERFTIRNSNKSYSAINIFSGNCKIKNCIIFDNGYGILIRNDRNKLLNCEIFKNEIGIYALSSNNSISNCIAFSNKNGIYINGRNNAILHSFVYNNSYGIHLENGVNNEIKDCKIFLNNVSGLFLEWSSNNNRISKCKIFENENGIRLFSSTDGNIVSECNISNNRGNGLEFYDTSNNNKILFCNIRNNSVGALLHWIFSAPVNCFHFNNITGNKNYGIFAEQCIVNATRNWWGSRDGPGGHASGKGDGINENVIYDPWLLTPIINKKPSIKIISPKEGEIIGEIYNITGMAFDENDYLAYVEIMVNGKWYKAIGNKKWYYLLDTKNLSEYKIVARCFDYVSYAYEMVNVIIDNIPPKVDILSPKGGIFDEEIEIKWKASDEHEIKIEISYYDKRWIKIASNEENDGIFEWNVKNIPNGIYRLRINATDVAGNIGCNETFFEVDHTLPKVEITKPKEGYIYIANRKLFHIPFKMAFIFGRIDVETKINATYGIDRVEFYINEELKYIANDKPYRWKMDNLIGKYELKIVAWDKKGRDNIDEIDIIAFC